MPNDDRPRVLVVEDEPDMNNLLADVLAAFDFKPLQATDGQQAFDLVQAEPPDAILLDLMLPGLSGYELCRRLKRSRATQRIPVLILTALDRHADRRSAYLAGADDFMTKPFVPDVLVNRLRACMEEVRQVCDTAGTLSRTIEPTGSLDDLKALNHLATGLCYRTDLPTAAVETLQQKLSALSETAAAWAAERAEDPPVRLALTLDEDRLRLRFEPAADSGQAFLAEHLAPDADAPSTLRSAGAIDRVDTDGEAVVLEKSLKPNRR